MKQLEYTEHNFRAIIRSYTPIGKNLTGMRDGKPFLRNGKLMVNFKDKLNEIIDIEFFNRNGKKIDLEKVDIDTDERISGIIVKDDKLLLLHRIKKGREYYVFPGGHRIHKETDIDTLKREMIEELNVEISENVKLIYTLTEEGFGIERFYLIKDLPDLVNMYKENPDKKEGEVNEIVFIEIQKAKKIQDIFPKEVVRRVSIYLKNSNNTQSERAFPKSQFS